MKNADNQNTRQLLPIKYDMLALFHSAQARTHFIARPAQRGTIGQGPAESLKSVNISCGLNLAPGAKRVFGDAEQVGLGAARKSKCCHGLRPDLAR